MWVKVLAVKTDSYDWIVCQTLDLGGNDTADVWWSESIFGPVQFCGIAPLDDVLPTAENSDIVEGLAEFKAQPHKSGYELTINYSFCNDDPVADNVTFKRLWAWVEQGMQS